MQYWRCIGVTALAVVGCVFDPGAGTGGDDAPGEPDARAVDAAPSADAAPPGTPDAAPAADAEVTATLIARLNLNGDALVGVDYPGDWAADPGSGGACSGFEWDEAQNPIHNTVDDILFQYQMYSTDMTCRVGDGSLAPGAYEVNLYFAEIYRGDGCPGGLGNRLINIDVEDQRVLTGFDLLAEGDGCAGSTTTTTGHPVVKSFQATVTDGQVTVHMTSDVLNVMISGIEVYAL